MRSILFVDDERDLLDGLRDLLRPQRHRWQTTFALGARDALRELNERAYDVVVTDMRMPGVDGADFLDRVRVEYPDSVRIILSGQTSFDATLRSLPVAHLFLTKPCDRTELVNALERALGLRDLLRDPELRGAAGGAATLPSLPRTYRELLDVVAKPDTSITDIAAVVERDVAMCAKLLQLVNSSFFGLRREVVRVDDAVNLLGLTTIKTLALSTAAFQHFAADVGTDAAFFDSLQDHSLLVARIATLILDDPAGRDPAFTAGLLHDLGKLVEHARTPERLNRALVAARETGRPLHLVEAEQHGVTHAEIGAYLLGIWGLPLDIVEAVAYHHAPGRHPEGRIAVLAAVHIADVIAHELAAPGDPCAPSLDKALVEQSGVSARIDAIRDAAADLAAGGVQT